MILLTLLEEQNLDLKHLKIKLRIMKNLMNKVKLPGMFLFFLIIFNSCGLEDVERQEVIAACENATDNNIQCQDCCVSNGFDTGSIDGFNDECECIDYVDN